MLRAVTPDPVQPCLPFGPQPNNLSPQERDALALSCLALAYSLARRAHRCHPWLELEELEGEALMKLAYAAKWFNPEYLHDGKPVRFTTYAQTAIQRHLWQYATRTHAAWGVRGRQLSALDMPGDDGEGTAFEATLPARPSEAIPQVDAADACVALRRALKRAINWGGQSDGGTRRTIPERVRREWTFLWLYYAEGWTLERIGGRFHISKERVRQVIKTATARLHRYEWRRRDTYREAGARA